MGRLPVDPVFGSNLSIGSAYFELKSTLGHGRSRRDHIHLLDKLFRYITALKIFAAVCGCDPQSLFSETLPRQIIAPRVVIVRLTTAVNTLEAGLLLIRPLLILAVLLSLCPFVFICQYL